MAEAPPPRRGWNNFRVIFPSSSWLSDASSSSLSIHATPPYQLFVGYDLKSTPLVTQVLSFDFIHSVCHTHEIATTTAAAGNGGGGDAQAPKIKVSRMFLIASPRELIVFVVGPHVSTKPAQVTTNTVTVRNAPPGSKIVWRRSQNVPFTTVTLTSTEQSLDLVCSQLPPAVKNWVEPPNWCGAPVNRVNPHCCWMSMEVWTFLKAVDEQQQQQMPASTPAFKRFGPLSQRIEHSTSDRIPINRLVWEQPICHGGYSTGPNRILQSSAQAQIGHAFLFAVRAIYLQHTTWASEYTAIDERDLAASSSATADPAVKAKVEDLLKKRCSHIYLMSHENNNPLHDDHRGRGAHIHVAMRWAVADPVRLGRRDETPHIYFDSRGSFAASATARWWVGSQYLYVNGDGSAFHLTDVIAIRNVRSGKFLHVHEQEHRAGQRFVLSSDGGLNEGSWFAPIVLHEEAESHGDAGSGGLLIVALLSVRSGHFVAAPPLSSGTGTTDAETPTESVSKYPVLQLAGDPSFPASLANPRALWRWDVARGTFSCVADPALALHVRLTKQQDGDAAVVFSDPDLRDRGSQWDVTVIKTGSPGGVDLTRLFQQQPQPEQQPANIVKTLGPALRSSQQLNCFKFSFVGFLKPEENSQVRPACVAVARNGVMTRQFVCSDDAMRGIVKVSEVDVTRGFVAASQLVVRYNPDTGEIIH